MWRSALDWTCLCRLVQDGFEEVAKRYGFEEEWLIVKKKQKGASTQWPSGSAHALAPAQGITPLLSEAQIAAAVGCIDGEEGLGVPLQRRTIASPWLHGNGTK